MEIFSAVITGANRGIGLEFVRQFACSVKPPRHIFATYRDKNTIQKLEEIQKNAPSAVEIHLVKLDVRDSGDLDNLRTVVEDTVGDRGLTLLINNAGVAKILPYPEVTAENLNFHFNVNTVGPVSVAQTLLPLLKKAASLRETPGMGFSKAAIMNISSFLASITDTGVKYLEDLDCPSYRISKAALNMAMRVMAATVKEDKVLIVNMCPGFVKTDMGTDEAEISPEESIGAMLNTVSKLNETHHGTFMDRHGNPYPW